MKKIFKWINHFCWEHFDFAFRVIHPIKTFKPEEGKVYFVYVSLSDIGYKAIYRDGEYYSIIDGKKIGLITKIQTF